MKDSKDFFEKAFGLIPVSWFDIYIKHFKKIVTGVVTLLLSVIMLLGWLSARTVREVVVDDFNKQQLILAQHAARQIENSLDIIKKELSLLSLSPSIQYFEKVGIGKRMEIAFSRINQEGVLEIRYIEPAKPRGHLTDIHGYRIVRTYPEDMDYLKWAALEKNKSNIFISEVFPVIYGSDYQKLVMKIALPVWQISVSESYPAATNKFSGVIIFVVDAVHVIAKTTREIRSGKTGYAWVIDKKGTFLFHPENEFVGKDAFEARKERKPTISFARINEIQKEKMLAGEEGASWYISGWHKGIEGEVNKLIAYAPIKLYNKNSVHPRFSNEEQGGLWSVAVVAPISEVEGAIHDIQIRQFLLEGIVIFAILFGGMLIIGMMLRWSSSLSTEVEKRTWELKKSENQYRSLIENANDIIFTMDRQGVITSINRSGLSFFEKTMEEIIGQNIGEICFNEESASLQLKAVYEVFDEKKIKNIEYPINIKGEEYWLNTNFSLLFDENGKPYAVLGISRNITADKKKAIEEQMYHTEKLASMGTLAAGVAHEINNPLALILGFSDMLLEKVKAGSNEYDTLKTIEKHALNAKRVVENLLSFARYTEQKEEFIDINANIEIVSAVVENTLKLHNISLTRKLQEKLPKVMADAGEIQQVFLNIMNNAIYAMKGGGTLTVTTGLSGSGRVEIRFADTGDGIKKEHRTKIFDPLFTTKKVGEGTGLGLSVSYGIITKYGGTITFETKTKEESGETGTTFIITLPSINITTAQ